MARAGVAAREFGSEFFAFFVHANSTSRALRRVNAQGFFRFRHPHGPRCARPCGPSGNEENPVTRLGPADRPLLFEVNQQQGERS
jgi:hypothetical protein